MAGYLPRTAAKAQLLEQSARDGQKVLALLAVVLLVFCAQRLYQYFQLRAARREKRRRPVD